MIRRFAQAVLFCTVFCAYGQSTSPSVDDSAPPPPEIWSIHLQATTISQKHQAINAPYQGTNSLDSTEPWRTTETATLYVGQSLWPGAELYINGEASGGKGLSRTVGLAGFPNGEATRVGNPALTPYLARLFVRQTFALGSKQEHVDSDLNQLAGSRPESNITITAGKVSAGDVFDDNAFSHDPRTQFENWSLMTNGAWDYPADTRGYTYGLSIEVNLADWSARIGSFAEPTEANGAKFDRKLSRALGNVFEVERRYSASQHKGTARLLIFANSAHMGRYADAVTSPSDSAPDVTLSRKYRIKYGAGINVEQELTKELGVFGRAGWNDGKTETWAFTEIDNSLSLGLSLKGNSWHRDRDTIGAAGVSNGLSVDHRNYLAAGGYGFIVGDGRLHYARENILETYYSMGVARFAFVSIDAQYVSNPAYNNDRGPVFVWGMRVHLVY